MLDRRAAVDTIDAGVRPRQLLKIGNDIDALVGKDVDVHVAWKSNLAAS
jgi:hypothetical protein